MTTKKRKDSSNQKSKSNSNNSRVIDSINAMKNSGLEDIQSDVQGSYRGSAKNNENPVQDQDDL